MEIRLYDKQDQAQIIELITNIQCNEFQIPITIKQQPDLLNIESFYQEKTGNFWVACIANKVIGTISLLDIGNQQAALRKLFVHKNYRSKQPNAAKQLLAVLLEWAKQQSMQEIFLGTSDKLMAAHRFYEKNGFAEVSQQNLPETFPVMEVDNKFYHYQVNGHL